MLRTRVITAVVALVILVAMLFFAGREAWALFVLAIALAGAWEWSRLCGLSKLGQRVFLMLSGVAGGALWMFYLRVDEARFATASLVAFATAAGFWILVAPGWLAAQWRPVPVVSAIAGWVVLWPTWFAFVVMRDAGPWVLLAAAAVVWIADIAAYFAGRRFGRHKLAPAVSPGKTWEGVAGALAGVLAYGVVLAILAHRFSTPVTPYFLPLAGFAAIVAMLVFAGVSVVGDLFESWMKRGAGVKDSSALLPGHGGILDRIDALTSTLPVAALAMMAVGGRS